MLWKASLPLLWAQDMDEQVETLAIAVRTRQCASQVSEQHGIYRKLVLWGSGRCELREDIKAVGYELTLHTAHV